MKKGFTLIELLISMAIISILAGIGIQQITDYTKTAYKTNMKLKLNELSTLETAYYLDNYSFSTDMTELNAINTVLEDSYKFSLKTCSNGDQGYSIIGSSSNFEEKYKLDGCSGTIALYNKITYDFKGKIASELSAFFSNLPDEYEVINGNKISYSLLIGTKTADGTFISELLTEIDYLGNVDGTTSNNQKIMPIIFNTRFDSLTSVKYLQLYNPPGFGPSYNLNLQTSKLNDITGLQSLTLESSYVVNKLKADSWICQNYSSITVKTKAGTAIPKSTMCL